MSEEQLKLFSVHKNRAAIKKVVAGIDSESVNSFEKKRDSLLIALINYKSVKSQILQIELRKTLCQFIQSYSDYSKEVKSKDKEALAKFENIIFSGIVADEGKIPSTFDGLDQLTKLAQAIKK